MNKGIINQSIDQVDPRLLKRHPRNPNQGDLGAILESVKENGFWGTIVANKRTGHVLAGNHRLSAAIEAGLPQVPVAWVDVSDEEEVRILLADNRTTRLGNDDESALAELLADLAQTETGLTGTGYDGDDLDEIIGRLAGEAGSGGTELLTDPDDVPDNAPTRCNTGDLWQLGRHRLLCGDSTKREDVERLMGGEKADMVFTDPPYGVDYDGGHAVKGVRREKLANDDTPNIYAHCLPIVFEFSEDAAALYLWYAGSKALAVITAVMAARYEVRTNIIWNKNLAQFGAIGAQYKMKHETCLYCFKKGKVPFWEGPNNEVSVWDVVREQRNEYHPTQKPVELAARAIKNSCPDGGAVLDIFGGSGATLIACEMAVRSAYLCELSPRYCDVILTRWENATGQSATLLEAGNGNTRTQDKAHAGG